MLKLLTQYFIVCSFFASVNAQTSPRNDTLIANPIASVLKLNESLQINDFKIIFKEVLSDSRCPKSVMCVRAGEAKVLVSVFKDETFVEDKIIYIYPQVASLLDIATNGFKIEIADLVPYPEAQKPINKSGYTLKLTTTWTKAYN